MQVYPVTTLDMRSHPFTQAVLALVFSFFKVSFLIACMLTNALVEITILNFGLCAKTVWMTSNVLSCFWKHRSVTLVKLALLYASECSSGSTGEKKLLNLPWLTLTFLLHCNSYFLEERAPHLVHADHTSSRQCYVQILSAFPFTRENKTCLPPSLMPCSKGRKSSLCWEKKQTQTKPIFSSHLAELVLCLVAVWTAK